MAQMQIVVEFDRQVANAVTIPPGATETFELHPAEGFSFISWGYDSWDGAAKVRIESAFISDNATRFYGRVTNEDTENSVTFSWVLLVMKK